MGWSYMKMKDSSESLRYWQTLCLTLAPDRYMIRAESISSPPEHSPIVILHGLGFGLIQYSTLALSLLHDLPPTQPVLIPLRPHISYSILHPFHMAPPPPHEAVRQLTSLFRRFHWAEEGVTMISHSKVSFVNVSAHNLYPQTRVYY